MTSEGVGRVAGDDDAEYTGEFDGLVRGLDTGGEEAGVVELGGAGMNEEVE